MKTCLLDTDIAVELLRGRNVHVAEQLASRSRDSVFLSTVTVAELMFGALRSSKSQENIVICRRFCSAFQLAELDREAAERSGVIRADLEERGERIGAYDLVASSWRPTTFAILGRVAGLQIEDWAAIA